MVPGVPTVLIGGMPAAVMGDMCTCVGPPDSIILGSAGVFIGGKPAARMGDMTAHGGSIVAGCPSVLIGETGGGGGGSVSVAVQIELMKATLLKMPPIVAATLSQVITLKEAAQSGEAFCEKCVEASGAK
jgi:hypothetical protein